tara:strand:- start:1786 stop:1926 length:141 start_codon:yes stop_codon:yes gene_type:complete
VVAIPELKKLKKKSLSGSSRLECLQKFYAKAVKLDKELKGLKTQKL